MNQVAAFAIDIYHSIRFSTSVYCVTMANGPVSAALTEITFVSR